MPWLLDTHVLLWALTEPGRLPSERRETLATTPDTVYFSAINIWEIAIKVSLGRRNFDFSPERVHQLSEQAGFVELPITALHAAMVARPPFHHRDPFERTPPYAEPRGRRPLGTPAKGQSTKRKG